MSFASAAVPEARDVAPGAGVVAQFLGYCAEAISRSLRGLMIAAIDRWARN
jgi:hypothetical protein